MDWNQISLETFIPELPKLWNQNLISVKRYLDIIYDENREIVIRPLETTGKVKATRGEFVTAVVDNLVVRNQFTNLLQNSTTSDFDYYTTYIGAATELRTADPSSWENPLFGYIDVNMPYYKISNAGPIAFLSNNLGQQIELMLDVSTGDNFEILLNPDPSSITSLTVDPSNADRSWFVLIAVDYDASYGTTWAVRMAEGTYTIN